MIETIVKGLVSEAMKGDPRALIAIGGCLIIAGAIGLYFKDGIELEVIYESTPSEGENPPHS